MSYSVQKIESIEDFISLKSTWDKVLGDKISYRPFLEYEWFELWLNHFLDKQKLLVLVVTQGDSPKAIFPLLIKKEKIKGIPIRKIELIGNIYSPVRNILFADRDSADMKRVLDILFSFLSALTNWDIMDLNSLPEEDFNFEMVNKVLRENRLKSMEYFCFSNLYLDEIEYSGDVYLNNRPKIIRKNVPYCQRKLEKMGNLEFNLVDSIDEIENHYI